MAKTSAVPKKKPSTTDHVMHEAKGWGTIAVLVVVGFILLPTLLGGAVKAMAPSADEMTCPGHVCPANGNRTAPTTPPTSVPYGPPNGPVRPLPSQLPTVSAPPARGNLPELGGSTGGGLLGELPAIGPVVAGGLKALGPGLKALAAP